MKQIKEISRGKRGRTFQGYTMDAWLKHREMVKKVDAEDKNSAKHQLSEGGEVKG